MLPDKLPASAECQDGFDNTTAAQNVAPNSRLHRSGVYVVLCALVLLGLAQGHLNAQTYQPTWDSLDKRPTPAWFTDAKFGIIIHWGVYSVPAYAPVIPGKLAYAEWY